MPHATLLQTLGMRHPVIQAPMAGVSTPRLAAAVSAAGGLGSLGLGASSPTQARALIAATRAHCDRPFNVNLFCHAPAQADPVREQAWLAHLRPHFQVLNACPPTRLSAPYPSSFADESGLELLLETRPAVASFHFGLPPRTWIDALRHAGILSFACITNPAEAAQAEAAAVDALVAQGIEAGGHRGVFNPANDSGLGLLPLLRLLRQQSRLPLIAAGGIMNGAGIAAALRLGAVAVQLGTAFIGCPESAANAAYRCALQHAGPASTGFTSAISGRPARGLVNRFHTDIDCPAAPPPPDYPIAYAAGKALAAAASAHDETAYAAHWAGQGASLARSLPAGELIETLAAETRIALSAHFLPVARIG